MSAFVKTTLVANDLARVKSGATPTRRFGGMAVEAPPAEVLSLLKQSAAADKIILDAIRWSTQVKAELLHIGGACLPSHLLT